MAEAPCFPALQERAGDGKSYVSPSVCPGLSQRDDWKAEVTECGGARERQERRMGSFIFRGRGGKSKS